MRYNTYDFLILLTNKKIMILKQAEIPAAINGNAFTPRIIELTAVEQQDGTKKAAIVLKEDASDETVDEQQALYIDDVVSIIEPPEDHSDNEAEANAQAQAGTETQQEEPQV